MPDTRPLETEIYIPAPAPGELWTPWIVHTHYYSFSADEGNIGAYLYLRWQPANHTSQVGICIFQGTDATESLDMAHHDYRNTLGWPEVSDDGRTFTTEQGYAIAYAEDLRSARLSYTSSDGSTSFDLDATGATPLYARGHVVPTEVGQDGHDLHPGGSDQIVHVVGELVLNDVRHAVDCYAFRDRSWGQLRPETTMATPPVSCIPQYYGPDLAFNVVSLEHPDTNPAWTGIYEWPEGKSSVLYGWGVVDGEFVDVVDAVRDASDYHPLHTVPQHQEVDVTFSNGKTVHVSGDMVSMTTVFTWANSIVRCGVYRWTAPDGRTTYDSYQEMYFDGQYARELKRRAGVISRPLRA